MIIIELASLIYHLLYKSSMSIVKDVILSNDDTNVSFALKTTYIYSLYFFTLLIGYCALGLTVFSYIVFLSGIKT